MIISENFPKMGKETVCEILEVQRVPCRVKPRRNMLRHIAIKLTKILRKNIKSNKGKLTNNIHGNSHEDIS